MAPFWILQVANPGYTTLWYFFQPTPEIQISSVVNFFCYPVYNYHKSKG